MINVVIKGYNVRNLSGIKIRFCAKDYISQCDLLLIKEFQKLSQGI